MPPRSSSRSGSLFRRRGEVDRAIAIHSRLRDHGGDGLRDKAAFALALDYQSAGLMDRAERVLEELAASREYRHAALDHLVSIYEAQGDWAKALKVFHELPPAVQLERATRRGALPVRARRARTACRAKPSVPARCCARRARTSRSCRARTSSRRASPSSAGDPGGALLLYLQALRDVPGTGAGDHPAGARHRPPGRTAPTC